MFADKVANVDVKGLDSETLALSEHPDIDLRGKVLHTLSPS